MKKYAIIPSCFIIPLRRLSVLKKQSDRLLKFLLTAAAMFMLIRIALYDGLIVRQYELRTPLVSVPHTFAVLSDLHATYYGDEQQTLFHTIRRYDPEAVFLVGDIADDKREFDGTAVLLEKICPDFPCYYVTGNHERWLDYTEDIKDLIRSYGVTVLDETADPQILGGEIRLFGLDDPLFYSDTQEYRSHLFSMESADSAFNLLLAHRPEFPDDYCSAGMDLVICGHTHGGQIRVPFLLNGLFAPGQGSFPEYAGGLYEMPDCTMIVSRGLMKNELPRVFNPPEVCIVRILPEE